MSVWDYLSRVDTLISLLTALFGSLLTWAWRKLSDRSKRNRRLQEIRQAARPDEIAICIRVGGHRDPVPDVRKYLQEHHPKISQLIVYQASSGDLEDAAIAARIIEDINEGIRAYGKGDGAIARLHFFPSGMVSYAPIIFTILSNWGKVLVYHKKADTYVPLYEVNKDRRFLEKREFEPLNNWQVVPVQQINSTNEVTADNPKD